METALRKSMFVGVPPFINFVPVGGFTAGEVIKGPQYWDEDRWDQDQLWRFTLAMVKWIEDYAESETKGSIADWEVSNRCLDITNGRITTISRRQVLELKF
jgi:hypothetical protein